MPAHRFTRALRTGNLVLVRAAAGELPSVRLDDALLVACLIEEQDGERYESAAVRWLGRFALECPTVRIEDLREGRWRSRRWPSTRRAPGARSRGCVRATGCGWRSKPNA